MNKVAWNGMCDADRWAWVLAYKQECVIVIDNDSTHVKVGKQYLEFDDFIGNANGLFDLAETLGLRMEHC